VILSVLPSKFPPHYLSRLCTCVRLPVVFDQLEKFLIWKQVASFNQVIKLINLKYYVLEGRRVAQNIHEVPLLHRHNRPRGSYLNDWNLWTSMPSFSYIVSNL